MRIMRVSDSTQPPRLFEADVPQPQPRRGELLVRVYAAGVRRGSRSRAACPPRRTRMRRAGPGTLLGAEVVRDWLAGANGAALLADASVRTGAVVAVDHVPPTEDVGRVGIDRQTQPLSGLVGRAL